MLLTVRRSKTDQYADGQAVAVVHGQHAATDPIAALDAWLHHRGAEPGRVFTSMRSGSVTSQPISGEAISIVLRKRARAAGLAAEQITAHSLRAGHATSAALAGVALGTGSPPRPSETDRGAAAPSGLEHLPGLSAQNEAAHGHEHMEVPAVR